MKWNSTCVWTLTLQTNESFWMLTTFKMSMPTVPASSGCGGRQAQCLHLVSTPSVLVDVVISIMTITLAAVDCLCFWDWEFTVLEKRSFLFLCFLPSNWYVSFPGSEVKEKRYALRNLEFFDVKEMTRFQFLCPYSWKCITQSDCWITDTLLRKASGASKNSTGEWDSPRLDRKDLASFPGLCYPSIWP